MAHKIVRRGVEIDLSVGGKVGCPKCMQEGRDRSRDNLHVYGLDSDGEHLGGKCFACNYLIPSEKWLEENRPITLEDMEYEMKGEEFNNEVHEGIKSITSFNSKNYRGITPETSRFFGVRYECDTGSGEIKASYYPVTRGILDGVQSSEAITGYKIRYHPKKFGAIGETGKESDLFGMFRFPTHKGIVVICAGEIDHLSAYQMLRDDYNARGNKRYDEVAVVSPTSGEGSINQFKRFYEWFNNFNKVIICYDNDKAGKIATEALAQVLPRGKVFVMPLRNKDVNEYVEKGMEREFISDFWAAKPYTPDGIKSSYDGFLEIKDELLKPRITLPPYMHKMEDMMGGGIQQGRIVNIIAATSSGKCFGKGTPILMYDGGIKKVEEVQVGDVVMGADGSPRNVLKLVRGEEEMYKVSQTTGDSYTVNKSHILSLRAGYDCKGSGVLKGDIVNIPVGEYLELGSKLRRSLKGYKAELTKLGEGVEVFEPYMLGLWLADGTSAKPQISVGHKDREILDEIEGFCSRHGYELKNSPSNVRENCTTWDIVGGFRAELSRMGLTNNKHIPEKYKMSSMDSRRELLAGLLDGDGYLDRGVYEVVQVNERLAEDIVFLARSLGLRTNIRDKFSKCQGFSGRNYKRITISGDVDKLPLRLERKKFTSKSELRRDLNTAISLKGLGVGNYYGFSLDGDHLFCLGDFTVTHNSTHANKMIHHWIFNSDLVPTIISLEATASQYNIDLLQTHLGINFTYGKTGEEVVEFLEQDWVQGKIRELQSKPDGSPRYYIIDERSGSIEEIEKQMELMFKKHGSKLFLLDIITDLLRGSNTDKSEDHMAFQKRLVKEGATIINVHHTTKIPLDKDGKVRDVTEYDAFGTSSYVQSGAINIVLNRDKIATGVIERNTTYVTMPKCRGGKTGDAGKWFFDFDTSNVYDLDDYKDKNPHLFVNK